MERLWKYAMTAAVSLGVLCLAVMMVYAGNKSVVITEEQDLKGKGNLDPLVKVILQEKEQYDYIVLINAAHGGDNKGNVVNELQEKTITLEVAKKLVKLSEIGEIGFFMIREEDTDISNESRAKVIARIAPDLVIDLHVNADPDNERTLGTAMVYNNNFYRPQMTNAQIADYMERELVSRIQGKALGIFPDMENKYPLLSMIEQPAVSVEMGFLTNKQEGNLLKKDSYQKLIAQGICEGVKKIREELDK